MTDNAQVLLTLVIPPKLEHDVIDYLLSIGETGFLSFVGSGHGGSGRGMSIVEQVAGRQKRVIFQIHTAHQRALTIRSELAAAFAGAELHYWIAPVLESGSI